MGSAKEQMMENEEARYEQELVSKMGITIDELHECDYYFHDETSDDGVVYGYYILFNEENSPKHILTKIGVDSMGRFELDNNSDE